MKFKTMMIIKAVVCLGFGTALLAVPDFVYNIFGATLNDGGRFAAREYSASMLGILMLTWFGRNAAPSVLRWAVTLGLTLYDAIGAVISVIAVLAGVLSPLGWLVVALYLFLTLGFGYFLIASPKTAVTASAP
jgi:hypothetical protein